MSRYQNFSQDTARYEGEIRRKDFFEDYLRRIDLLGITSVTDFGMGSGDFLYHLPDTVKGIGIDKSKALVKVANQSRKKSNLSFRQADIGRDSIFEPTELVVMTGFLCTFLDYKLVLDTALKTATKHVFINDFFNDHGVDARFSFREPGQSEFQTPYNIWSKKTIESYLGGLGLLYEMVPYALSTKLRELPHPLYNFHASLDGQQIITNRGGIILYGYNVFIRKA